MTADDNYSLLNRDNLTQPIQTILSPKQKVFSQFFLAFWKCALNFEHFQKKDDPHSRFISRNYAPRKTWLDICPKTPVSKDPLTRQHGKWVQTLVAIWENGTVTIFTDHFER